jgi:hypothetical protein
VKIAPIIDEFIIVDTGSTDRTKQEIKRFKRISSVPVKVYDYAWCDNFSIIRNFAISKSTQRWLLHLDADERFEDKDLPVISKMIDDEDNFDAYLFDVNNYLKPPISNTKPEVAVTQNIRLFRNIPEHYYTGIIHETLDDCMQLKKMRGNLKLGRSPVKLQHHGYLKPKDKIKEKLDRYVMLNEKQIEITGGEDPRPYYNLALHWLQEDDKEKAKIYLEKAVKLKPDFWQANAELASINIREGKKYLKHILNILPDEHNFKRLATPIVGFLDKRDFGHQKIDLGENKVG